MPDTVVVVAISVGYLVLSLIVGILPGRGSSASAEGYVAGDRGLGLLVMYFITGAMVFSAFAFLGGPGWAYGKGVAALYILGYGALGMVPLYFLGPRAARVGRRFGFVTQAQLVAARYQRPALAVTMAIISVVALIPYLAIQMKGAGYVLETMTRGAVPQWAGAAAVYCVVLAYVLKSGVLGVGWTNTLQGIFMMVLAWGLGLYLPTALYGGVDEMFTQIAQERPQMLVPPGLSTPGGPPWSWAEYSSAVVVSIIGFTMWPQLFMKAFTAKDERTLRRTVVLYPTFQIFLVPLFLIGFAGIFFASPPEHPDQILPHMLMNMDLPAVVVGLFCAGALAASMSSGDAMAHAAASISIRDGWVSWAKVSLSPERERRWMRIGVVVVMLVAYVVAIGYQGSLVFLLLSTYGAVVQFMPAVALGLYAKWPSGLGVMAGLLAGCALTLLFTALPDLRPWPLHAGLYGLVLNVGVLALVSWQRPDDERHANAFLAVAQTPAPDEAT